jgi:hypothetical protein
MPGRPTNVEKVEKKRANPTALPSSSANTTSAYGRPPNKLSRIDSSVATT